MNEASNADAPLKKDLALAGRHRALTRVAPGLVHELRGPLNAVHLNLELLKARTGSVEGETGDKLRGYLDVVEEELERFQERFDRFVEQLFPPRTRERRELDLRRTLDEVRELLKIQAHKEGVDLKVDVPDEPMVVEGASDVLRDAVLLMAVHGLGTDSSPRGGALELSLQTVEGRARVTVRAEGAMDAMEDLVPSAARALWEAQGGTVTLGTNAAAEHEILMEFPRREGRERNE